MWAVVPILPKPIVQVFELPDAVVVPERVNLLFASVVLVTTA